MAETSMSLDELVRKLMGDEHADVAGGGFDGDGETALAVFAEDDVGAFGLADIGDEGERNAATLVGLDGELGEFLGRVAPEEWESDDEIDGALALAEFGDGFAADEGAELVVEGAGGDAVGGGRLGGPRGRRGSGPR